MVFDGRHLHQIVSEDSDDAAYWGLRDLFYSATARLRIPSANIALNQTKAESFVNRRCQIIFVFHDAPVAVGK